MKKLMAALMIAALALSCTAAFAATYVDRDGELTFEYDEALFEISTDDETDDELLVILGAKDEAWGDTYVKIHLADLDDGETFPTPDDVAASLGTADIEVTQGEWNGYEDVIMYDFPDDSAIESVFIVPVYDADDGEVDEVMTIDIGITDLDDEAAMTRDDAISTVLDSLTFIDD